MRTEFLSQILRSRTLLGVAISGIAVLAVACSSSPAATEFAPTATAIPPTATIAVSQDTPVAVPDGISPELAAFLAEVDRRMSEIRKIPVAEPVPFRFLNQEEMRQYLLDQFDDPEVIEEFAESEALLRLLGLIPQDRSLFEIYSILLGTQVLGAYDPEKEEFVVLQKSDAFGVSQEFTYAHEYIHRLQDAAFGLDEITERLEGNGDRSLAFSALVEGDATTAQQLYALQYFDFEALAQLLEDSSDVLEDSRGAPYILQKSLEFPYIEGATFVERLRASRGVEGIDAAFANPPDSTEQVIHPEKYVNREVPDEVVLPENLFAASGPLGAGWEVIEEDVLGEFFLRTWLEAIGARATDAAEAAAGWGGDSTVLAVNEAGEHVFAAKVVWDDPGLDAQQFFAVMTTIMAASPDFRAVDIGEAPAGIRAYEGAGGVIVAATLSSAVNGEFTVVTAAESLAEAMPLALALVEQVG